MLGIFLFAVTNHVTKRVCDGWRATIPSEPKRQIFARLVVPRELRVIAGKTELGAPLGPDRRTAMKLSIGIQTWV
ncbi:hypothetical protein CDV54_11625 [Paracoccus yeei]|nr:hypothetical protein CDV54_11625 [Paracoccus yeei]